MLTSGSLRKSFFVVEVVVAVVSLLGDTRSGRIPGKHNVENKMMFRMNYKYAAETNHTGMHNPHSVPFYFVATPCLKGGFNVTHLMPLCNIWFEHETIQNTFNAFLYILNVLC